MLEYYRIDVSEGIDVTTNVSEECHIFHYWYFLNRDFKHEPCLCNGCHNAKSHEAIVFVKGSDCRIRKLLLKTHFINVKKIIIIDEEVINWWNWVNTVI